MLGVVVVDVVVVVVAGVVLGTGSQKSAHPVTFNATPFTVKDPSKHLTVSE